MPQLPSLLPMCPYLREMVWGGRRLEGLYGKRLPPGQRIGEALELSAYPGRDSRVGAGPLQGRTLGSLVRQFGPDLVGDAVWRRDGVRLPLLIKLLDAQQDLSIQVHPDDDYARLHRLDGAGKAEAWFVLHSQGGRVAYGLQPEVTAARLAQAVANGRIDTVVRFWEVAAGDVLYIPPGTVHALGRGVVVYEVQQSSDVTFRIYDYGRPGLDGKPRQLHLDRAIEVIDFRTGLGGPRPWRQVAAAGQRPAGLVACEHFQLELYCLDGGALPHAAGGSFAAVTTVQGAVRLVDDDGGSADLPAGATALVPAGRRFAAEPLASGECVYLVATSGGLDARARESATAIWREVG